jgi:hypothetical protein
MPTQVQPFIVHWQVGKVTIKAKKILGKVDEAIVKTDSTVDHALDLIKSSKRTVLIIILIVGLIIWMV